MTCQYQKLRKYPDCYEDCPDPSNCPFKQYYTKDDIKLPDNPEFTHDNLVKVARLWLLNKKDCSVVLTEKASSLGEIPDAIGWHHKGSSVLVECKVSLQDLRADKKKNRDGLGMERYYLTPKGMIKDPDISLPAEYGLLEWDGKTDYGLIKNHVRVKRKAVFLKPLSTVDPEIVLLLSALRAVGMNTPEGISVRCYTITTKNKATLTIAKEFFPEWKDFTVTRLSADSNEEVVTLKFERRNNE